MRLGYSLPNFVSDPQSTLRAAERALELEVDGLFSTDHLFPPGSPDKPSLEAFALLSALAARHPGVTLGTLVARASLRPAGILAKQAAALDQMTGGRFILGIGSGDQVSRDEHVRFGIPFAEEPADRVALLEEVARGARALFEGRTWEGGEHVPRMTGPLRPAGAPAIWVGGTSGPVLDVAGRVADAWNGWGLDAERFARSADRVRAAAGDRAVEVTWGGIALVGEDRADLDALLRDRRDRDLPFHGMWSGTASDLRAFVGALTNAGCTWFVVLPAGPKDRLALIAEAVRGA
jgi:alkanesulfonate monooxygenase SsuD/methylene tetrahydromethanopterin reductase-like flavin-dependent oxidoreductase (luciferase family)